MTQDTCIGITDTGQPLVLADGCCEYWIPGSHRLLNSKTCWYCQWADFRKTTLITISHSICRCLENRVPIVRGSENEKLGCSHKKIIK